MKASPIASGIFSIVNKDGREFISIDQVTRLMADGPCTWVYLQNGRSILTSKNLGYYDSILPKPINQLQNTFFRIHYRHIINLSCLEGYNAKEKYIKIFNGLTLPVAQRRVGQFCKMLKSFHLY